VLAAFRVGPAPWRSCSPSLLLVGPPVPHPTGTLNLMANMAPSSRWASWSITDRALDCVNQYCEGRPARVIVLAVGPAPPILMTALTRSWGSCPGPAAAGGWAYYYPRHARSWAAFRVPPHPDRAALHQLRPGKRRHLGRPRLGSEQSRSSRRRPRPARRLTAGVVSREIVLSLLREEALSPLGRRGLSTGSGRRSRTVIRRVR
jgi:hypothetical protein